ncbi:MAG: hypothetical protein Q8P67_03930 [archaeon]|nr:hypothetical protein [archaeon]
MLSEPSPYVARSTALLSIPLGGEKSTSSSEGARGFVPPGIGVSGVEIDAKSRIGTKIWTRFTSCGPSLLEGDRSDEIDGVDGGEYIL